MALGNIFKKIKSEKLATRATKKIAKASSGAVYRKELVRQGKIAAKRKAIEEIKRRNRKFSDKFKGIRKPSLSRFI